MKLKTQRVRSWLLSTRQAVASTSAVEQFSPFHRNITEDAENEMKVPSTFFEHLRNPNYELDDVMQKYGQNGRFTFEIDRLNNSSLWNIVPFFNF